MPRTRARGRLRLPGAAFRLSRRRPAWRAERRSSACRVRVVHAEPRSGGQPRARRAVVGARRRRPRARARRMRAAAPSGAAALHGRGIRGIDAISFLLRLRRGACRCRDRAAGARNLRASRASRDSSAREIIPDPNAGATFAASKLDWREAFAPAGVQWRAFYSRCLSLRRRHVVPLLAAIRRGGTFTARGGLLHVRWSAGDAARLHLVANLEPDGREGVDAAARRIDLRRRRRPGARYRRPYARLRRRVDRASM